MNYQDVAKNYIFHAAAGFGVAAISGFVNPVQAAVSGIFLGIGRSVKALTGKTISPGLDFLAQVAITTVGTQFALIALGTPITFKASLILLGFTVASAGLAAWLIGGIVGLAVLANIKPAF